MMKLCKNCKHCYKEYVEFGDNGWMNYYCKLFEAPERIFYTNPQSGEVSLYGSFSRCPTKTEKEIKELQKEALKYGICHIKSNFMKYIIKYYKLCMYVNPDGKCKDYEESS